ncbi:TPA: tyrosine-type recombinase/integrase [Legionella pneumophila]|nr:tyrosine-type recombinase/integrase [Legionella pneumophila]HAT1660843.1 tyrosine-type recombinase/integrase [Legionella pneumophila]
MLLVLDNEYKPIKYITEFIKYLRNVDKSPCTIKGYAHSLKLYWEFLAAHEIDWTAINIGILAQFVGWLRTRENERNVIDLTQLRIERHNSSINAILGALSSFYRYHNQVGNTDFTLTEAVRLPGNRFKSLLHYVFKDKPVQRRIVSVKQPKNLPKTITQTQFIQLSDACTNYRDKFLLWLLYETGIRIGQALALRHEDVICWDNEIHIKYRTNNLNKVRGKSLKPNVVQVSSSVMSLYSDYVSTLDQICALHYDCLEQDGDGDSMLRVKEQKLNRIRLIPISKHCIDAIKCQQKLTYDENGSSKYLFPSNRSHSKSPTVVAPHINRALNRLAIENEIKDSNGVIFRFSSHQFRHTVGTQMINNGVPQVIVQQYLGHESPEMTARYAQIHDTTMKKAFINFQEKMVDIKGNVSSSDEHINAKWLKKNIMSQSLPNGLCALPLSQKRCPHANACLTCSNFRTTKQYLPNHKAQLVETNKIIENAKQNGWQRLVEMNTDVASNLKSIIEQLENDNER